MKCGCLIIFSSILRTWYVQVRNISISESPLDFEITWPDCIRLDAEIISLSHKIMVHYSPDNRGYPHNIFLLLYENMLWVLIRSASVRRFWWVPTTYFLWRNKKNFMWIHHLIWAVMDQDFVWQWNYFCVKPYTVHSRYLKVQGTLWNTMIYYELKQLWFFFFFFWFGFYGPFKNISLISSRSFIKGWRKPENPEKNHLTIRKQNLAFPHMTRARLEPQRWET